MYMYIHKMRREKEMLSCSRKNSPSERKKSKNFLTAFFWGGGGGGGGGGTPSGTDFPIHIDTTKGGEGGKCVCNRLKKK